MARVSAVLIFSGVMGSLLASGLAFANTEVPQVFTYEGRLYNSSDEPLTESVTFKLQILNQAENCLLYEETQVKDLSSSSGRFALEVGSATGASKRSTNDPGFSMWQVFKNTGSLAVPVGVCAGTPYNPSLGEKRKLRVSVTPASTGVAEVLSPSQSITSAPSSMMSQSLQGVGKDGFIQVVGSVTQADVESLLDGSDIGSSLHNHDSIYAKVSGSGSMTFGSGATLGLGSFDNTQETALTGGLAAGDAGKTWYNSDTGLIMYWDGSSAQAVGTSSGGIMNINGHTGSSQTFTTPGTTGTAPNWDFATANQHKLNIPLASTATVVAGLLSNTDYATFSSKLSNTSVPNAAGDIAGDFSTGLTIQNDAVTGSMILDGQVDTADLASSAVTTAKIADSNVTTAKIADSNVTTAKLADGSVTLPKLDATGATALQAIRRNSGNTAWEYYTPMTGDVSSSRALTAGAGLTGGGDLSADRTFNVGAGAGISVAADSVAVDITSTTAETTADNADEILIYDSSATALRKMTRANFLSGIGGNDNLGNHEATQNIDLNTFKLVGNNGTSGIAIDSSGNVGVGTASPQTSAHVLKSGAATTFTSEVVGGFENNVAAGTNAAVAVVSGSTGTSSLYLGGNVSGSSYNNGRITHNANTGSLGLFTADTEKVTVLSGGNVGMGTTSPQSRLHVYEDSGIVSRMRIQDGNTTAGSGFAELLLQDDGSPVDQRRWGLRTTSGVSGNFMIGDLNDAETVFTHRLVIDHSGSIGMGTLTPSAGLKLDVEGKIGATNYCDENGSNCFTAAGVSSGTGETNTVSNLTGTAGAVGVFKQKNGVNFEMKKINAGSTKVTITDDTGNNEVDIDIAEANINHDNLSGFVANEHIDHSSVSIATAAGTSGLTGGGNLTATRNLSIDISGTTAVTAADNADSILIYDNSASGLRSQTRANFLSGIATSSDLTSKADDSAVLKKDGSVALTSAWNTGNQNINNVANMSIGTASANASAALDITSTTKGFLPPRMTTAQRDAISSPATGLQVFNTTAGKFQFYNGSAWTDLGSGGSAAQIADTDGDTKVQVEESADEDKIRFDTAGTQRMVIDNSGQVGIGTDTPVATLDVNGPIRPGTSAATCTSALTGLIRRNGNELEVCQSGYWLALSRRGTGDMTLYVRTDGSDSLCDGSTDASSASAPACAFASPQKALNTLPDIITGLVTISIGNGTYYLDESATYADSTIAIPVRQYSGNGSLLIKSTSGTVTISGAKASASTTAVAGFTISGVGVTRVSLQSLTVTYGVNGCVYFESSTSISVDSITMGNSAYGLRVANGSHVKVTGTLVASVSITSWAIYANNGSSITASSVTFTSSAPYGIAIYDNSLAGFDSASTISITGAVVGGISVYGSSRFSNTATTTISSTAVAANGLAIRADYNSTYVHSTNSLAVTASGSGDWQYGFYASYNGSIILSMASGKTLTVSTTAETATQVGFYAVQGSLVYVYGAGNVSVSANYDYEARSMYRSSVVLSSTGTVPGAPNMTGNYNSVVSTAGSWTTNGTCDASSNCL